MEFVGARKKKSIAIYLLGVTLHGLPAYGSPNTNPGAGQKPLSKTIVFVRNEAPSIKEVFENMKKELSDFSIQEVVLQSQTSFSEFSKEIIKRSPDFLVLMDNQSVEF